MKKIALYMVIAIFLCIKTTSFAGYDNTGACYITLYNSKEDRSKTWCEPSRTYVWCEKKAQWHRNLLPEFSFYFRWERNQNCNK